ncbi:hypothetical protein GGF31_006264 [Allomyces arbusculus]|nr:hypothetical protein GGF31_006264 [Allomyces arbusculus]
MFPSTAAAAKLPRETTLRTYGKRKVAVLPHSFIGLGVPAAPPTATVEAPLATTLDIHDPFALPDDDNTDPIEARLKRIRTGTSKAAARARAQAKSKPALFDYPFVDKSPVRKPTVAARRRKLKEQEDADWKPEAATARKAPRKPRKTTKKAVAEPAAPVPAPEEIAPSAASDDMVRIAATVPTLNDDDASPVPVPAPPRASSPMLDVPPSTDSGLDQSLPQDDDMNVDPSPASLLLPATVEPVTAPEPLLAPETEPELASTRADLPSHSGMAIDWDAPFTFTADGLTVAPTSSSHGPSAPTVLRSSPIRVPPSPPARSLIESAHDDDDAMDVDPSPLVLTLLDTPLDTLQPTAPADASTAPARERTDSGVGDDMPPASVSEEVDEMREDDDDDDDCNVPFFLSPHAAEGASSSDEDEFDHTGSPLANRPVAVRARTAPVPSGLQQYVALSSSPPPPSSPLGAISANGACQIASPSPARSAIAAAPVSDAGERADAAPLPRLINLTSPSPAPTTGPCATSTPATPAPTSSSRVLFVTPATPAPPSLPHTLPGLLHLCALSRSSSSTNTVAPVSFDDTLFGGRSYRPRLPTAFTSLVTKLGEASYSDVYLVRRPTGAPPVADGSRETVVKIMPFTVPDPHTPTPRRHRAVRDRRMSVAVIRRAEPGTPVRGRPPMAVVDEDEDDAPETREVAMLVPELAVALRVARIRGFLPTVQVDVVRAPAPGARDREGYHPALLSAFDAFATSVPHVAWNPRPPSIVPAGSAPMWYCAVHMPHGGTALEDARIRDVWSCLVQIAKAVGEAERECEFEHRDLHWGNVLVDSEGTCRVIDFTFGRCVVAGGSVQYAPIPDHVFEGDEDEDEQFAVYRRMREVVERGGKGWNGYYPQTNVLWLQYLARKLVTKTDDKGVQKALMDVADRLASVPTAADAVPLIEAAMAVAAGKGRSA